MLSVICDLMRSELEGKGYQEVNVGDEPDERCEETENASKSS